MHEKQGKHGARERDSHEEAEREAVVAADDTGLVSQQERLHVVEVEDDGKQRSS